MTLRLSLSILLAAASPAVLAHPEAATRSLVHGFAHPFTGMDHLLAMVLVGVWAARRAGWGRRPC